MVELYHWHNEPLLIGGLLGTAYAYSLFTGPLRGRCFGQRPLPAHCPWCFYGALVLFYLTVGSPLDALGEGFLFSAHMVQHNLLMYACPPLFLLGLPSWMVDDVFVRQPWLRKLTHAATRPLVAGICFSFVFSVWHLPSLYEPALRIKWLHMLEHLTMLLTSLQMWWGFLAPSRLVPKFHTGTQIVYLFALMVAQLPLFAVLTFESEVLYQTYEWAQRVTPLSAHEDQVLGGLIMKIANMIVSLGLLAGIFLTWEQSQQAHPTRVRTALA
ncbi:MAG: cytochrome c oxidase assembly protein [Opitutales bacterium]